MRSLPLTTLLAGCFPELTGEPAEPPADLMVSLASGPEADTVDAGSENVEVGCANFAANVTATVDGLLFMDANQAGLAGSAILTENDEPLTDETRATPTGDLGFRDLDWTVTEGTNRTLCLIVDFGVYGGTAEYGLPAPEMVDTENSVDGNAIFGPVEVN